MAPSIISIVTNLYYIYIYYFSYSHTTDTQYRNNGFWLALLLLLFGFADGKVGNDGVVTAVVDNMAKGSS